MESQQQDHLLVADDTRFLYPFRQNVLREPTSLKEQQSAIRALPSVWKPWWKRVAPDTPQSSKSEESTNLQELAGVLDDTHFFLPYIRNVLFPETGWLNEKQATPDHRAWSDVIKSQYALDLNTYADHMKDAIDCMHLTYDNHVFPLPSPFQLSMNGKPQPPVEIAANLISADVLLFTSGIGLLVLHVNLAEDHPTLGILMSLQRLFRTVHAPSVGIQLAQSKFDSGLNCTTRDLVDFLLQGLVDPGKRLNDDPRQYLQDCDGVAPPNDLSERYSQTDLGQAFGERCLINSFACIDGTMDDLDSSPKGVFATGSERVMTEMAYCRPLQCMVDDPHWQPAPPWANEMSEKMFRVWRCWSGMATPEGFFGLAEASQYNKDVLSSNVKNDYFMLHSYVVFLKFQLYFFSSEMMGAVGQVRFLRTMRERFIRFRNRYWFSEISRRWLGNRLFRLFVDNMEVVDVYRLVEEEIREIQDHLESIESRRINNAITAFTFLVTPIATGLAICSVPTVSEYLSATGKKYWWFPWTAIVLIVMASSFVVFLAMRFLNRRKKPFP